MINYEQFCGIPIEEAKAVKEISVQELAALKENKIDFHIEKLNAQKIDNPRHFEWL